MPDEQAIAPPSQTEDTILTLLLTDCDQRPWSIEELSREIGRPTDVIDAVTALHGAGLIHRIGDFVFASRAAVHYDQIGI